MAQNFMASSQVFFLKKILRRVMLIFLFIATFLLIFLGKTDNIIIENSTRFLTDVGAKVITYLGKPFIFAKEGYTTVKNLFGVEEENARLKEVIEDLNIKISDMKNLAAENEELKKSLRFVADIPEKFITTRVIADNTSIFSHSLLIEAGSNHGVEKYQAVIAKGYLIGRIIAVTPQYSRVLLITDISSKVPVILEKSRIRAFLSGNNDDYPRLTHIEKQGMISEHEEVLTSGFDGILPYGIRIGFIAGIEEESPFIQPYIGLSDIEIVSVLKNKPQIPVAKETKGSRR